MRPSGCLDENSVVAFFERRLTGEAADRVDRHAASCEACRRLLAEYAGASPEADRGTAPLASSRGAPDGEKRGAAEPAEAARLAALAAAARRVGTVLCGKWRIDRLIGMGGMAQVFAATHRNGRQVAVKMMRPHLTAEPSLVERFSREGYVANRVEHDGAVAILDDDVTDDGAPFLVMELLKGRTLRERLVTDGVIALPDALRIVDEALDVLASAHERGVVHRDIKPDNLFEIEDGRIKVLDFGIARVREQAVNAQETMSGTTMGTLGYMPPEQARGHVQDVDARSDVWAVGATLYTLLSGQRLHEAPTPSESLLLAMSLPAPSGAALLPSAPPDVQALLDAALARDKEARFADGRAMQIAVRAARGLGPPRASTSAALRSPAPTVDAPVDAYASTFLGVSVTDGTLKLPPSSRPAPPVSVAARGGRRTRGWLLAGVGVFGAALGFVLVFPRAHVSAAPARPAESVAPAAAAPPATLAPEGAAPASEPPAPPAAPATSHATTGRAAPTPARAKAHTATPAPSQTVSSPSKPLDPLGPRF